MDLYQELILEHSKRPHGAGLREPFEAEVHHVNPTCGDEVTLRLQLSEDRTRVDDVSYDAQGCAISRASTSVLHDLVAGRPVADGLRWQAPQSVGTMRVRVGAPPDQANASCFISPDAGTRAGFDAVGPTKPLGMASAWQSPHDVGWGMSMLASDEWKLPGK